MQNFEELKVKVIEELKKRAPDLKCPVCSSPTAPHRKLILVDGLFNRSIQKDVSGGIVIGGPTVPTVGVICENCGYVMEFSIGALGLLNQK